MIENNYQIEHEDWVRYDYLMRKDPDKRTKEEEQFCKDMYHEEEFYGGIL